MAAENICFYSCAEKKLNMISRSQSYVPKILQDSQFGKKGCDNVCFKID